MVDLKLTIRQLEYKRCSVANQPAPFKKKLTRQDESLLSGNSGKFHNLEDYGIVQCVSKSFEMLYLE
jgi:hypothetical protein